MKTYLISIIISATLLVFYLAFTQLVFQEQSMSKQCDIPYDVNFKKRRAQSSPANIPSSSIEEEFSIFSTIPIGLFAVNEEAHSLILKPVPTSHGYIIMCDPLSVLEKRFDTKLHGLFILVDGEEIAPNLVNDVLRIDVDGNTRIEII